MDIRILSLRPTKLVNFRKNLFYIDGTQKTMNDGKPSSRQWEGIPDEEEHEPEPEESD